MRCVFACDHILLLLEIFVIDILHILTQLIQYIYILLRPWFPSYFRSYFGTSYFIVTLRELGKHYENILVTQYNMESRVYDLFDRGSIFMASSSHLEGNNNSMQPCIGLKRVPCQTIKELSTIQSGFWLQI